MSKTIRSEYAANQQLHSTHTQKTQTREDWRATLARRDARRAAYRNSVRPVAVMHAQRGRIVLHVLAYLGTMALAIGAAVATII